MLVIDVVDTTQEPTRAAKRETADRTADPELAAQFEREAIPLLKPLHRHATRITGNRLDAEDLMQDAGQRPMQAWPRSSKAATSGDGCIGF